MKLTKWFNLMAVRQEKQRKIENPFVVINLLIEKTLKKGADKPGVK